MIFGYLYRLTDRLMLWYVRALIQDCFAHLITVRLSICILLTPLIYKLVLHQTSRQMKLPLKLPFLNRQLMKLETLSPSACILSTTLNKKVALLPSFYSPTHHSSINDVHCPTNSF